jgi:hypothetical protein
MARLYADEDFDRSVVDQLRKFGHDVVTARKAGHAGQGILDPDVLAFAISQSRAVLTFNRRHFIRLHAIVRTHRGIIVCTRDQDATPLAGRIHQAILNSPSLDNQLIRIVRPGPP